MSTERPWINVLLRSEQSGEQIAVMDNVADAALGGPIGITPARLDDRDPWCTC